MRLCRCFSLFKSRLPAKLSIFFHQRPIRSSPFYYRSSLNLFFFSPAMFSPQEGSDQQSLDTPLFQETGQEGVESDFEELLRGSGRRAHEYQRRWRPKSTDRAYRSKQKEWTVSAPEFREHRRKRGGSDHQTDWMQGILEPATALP